MSFAEIIINYVNPYLPTVLALLSFIPMTSAFLATVKKLINQHKNELETVKKELKHAENEMKAVMEQYNKIQKQLSLIIDDTKRVRDYEKSIE